MTWKALCEKHGYRRFSENPIEISPVAQPVRPAPYPLLGTESSDSGSGLSTPTSLFASHQSTSSKSFDSATSAVALRRPKIRSYKSHFKQRYRVETAWRTRGTMIDKHITPDQGVVTSLHLTPKYIVVALDKAKIHVFNTDGGQQKTLQGHVMGVWAMIPWGDTLVSGGCDRDVRVWNLATGYASFSV